MEKETKKKEKVLEYVFIVENIDGICQGVFSTKEKAYDAAITMNRMFPFIGAKVAEYSID